jgi:Outer membrane protein beta-barrel domain
MWGCTPYWLYLTPRPRFNGNRSLSFRTMRQRFLLASAFLLAVTCTTVTTGNAQRGIQVGLRVTPQLSMMPSGSYADSLDRTATGGVSGGISIGYGFNYRSSLILEALYSSQGQNFEYTYPNPTFTAGSNLPEDIEVRRTVRMRYLKLPVMFKYGTDMERKYAIYGMLGPQFEYLFSVDDDNNDRREYTNEPYLPSGERAAGFPWEDIDRYNRVNISVVGAFGLDVKLRFNLRMNLQVRADYGLLDVRKKDVEFNVNANGVDQTYNYWDDYLQHTDPIRNLNVGLTLGFTYIFIPRFHY